ncbi:MAG: hypothetical protein J5518_00590 [Lachnospiraceae bacterium]|nr:hypothetical protein [Lachnospiraceae bacterium]
MASDEKRNTTEYLLLILFGGCVMLTFLLYLILPQNDFSQKENRYLQTRPAITLSGLKDGSFMDKFDTYTTEQLPFRECLVDVKAMLNALTLNRENNDIVLGADGYLFEKCYGKSTQLSKNETAILTFIENAGRPVTVAIAPTASEILKDKVPAGCPQADQSAELKDLYDRIDALPNGNSVDLAAVLAAENAGSGVQLYYRTDHHWTTDAAYLAYGEIVGAENAVDQASLTRHSVDDFYGTMAAKYKGTDLSSDTLVWYDVPIETFRRSDGDFDTLYDLDKLEIYDKYAMFLRGNDEICTIGAENAKTGRHLIVCKDSYANCLIPFLTYNYDRITVVDLRYYAESLAGLLAEDPDADILLLYNFSFLNEDNHFYRLTS